MGCEFKYHWKIVLDFYLTLFILTVSAYFTYKVVMKSNVNEEKLFYKSNIFSFLPGIGSFHCKYEDIHR